MAPTPADRRVQAALHELAAEDVIELIAQAREEARARVRSQLVDALADAMLERAYRKIAECAEPEAKRAPDREPTATREQPSTPGATGVYSYCVVPADTQLSDGLPSIDPAHPPTVIRHDRLAAVVSRVPLSDFGEERLRERLADMDWLERTARAHELTLETIGRHATLIPMRLCSVYRDESGVTEMLAREARALEEALVHLDGKSEWGVKVFTNSAGGRGAEIADSGISGTDYMQRRRTDRDRRHTADQQLYDACVAIHERLAGVVADALTSPAQRPEVSGHPGQMLLNGVYLVEDDQRHNFLALVDELTARFQTQGLELQATGPWPAYNFVPGTIGAAW